MLDSRGLAKHSGLLFAGPTWLVADTGERLSPEALATAWSFDPLLVFNLVVLGGLYYRGWRRRSRTAAPARNRARGSAAAFYVALGVVALALLSPLDALSQELSAAHMVQHLLLMSLAAPLVAFSMPVATLAQAMTRTWRELSGLRWFGHRLTWNPTAVWLLYAVVLWGWHHPVMYQAALRDPLVHDAQHLTFFGAGVLFWRIVLVREGRRGLHPVHAVAYLFSTSLHAALLGIFLTLAPAPWYSDYVGRTEEFGWTPLRDQQLAGLLMWVPACLIYPVSAAAILGRWLGRESPPLSSAHVKCQS